MRPQGPVAASLLLALILVGAVALVTVGMMQLSGGSQRITCVPTRQGSPCWLTTSTFERLRPFSASMLSIS